MTMCIGTLHKACAHARVYDAGTPLAFCTRHTRLFCALAKESPSTGDDGHALVQAELAPAQAAQWQ